MYLVDCISDLVNRSVVAVPTWTVSVFLLVVVAVVVVSTPVVLLVLDVFRVLALVPVVVASSQSRSLHCKNFQVLNK
jgi:hypothetical protein